METAITPYLENGYGVSGLATTYVDVSTIAAEIYILTGHDIPNAVSLTKQLIQDYTNPLVLAEYGGDFSLAGLEFLLKSKIPGLQNVVFITVAGIAAADVVVANTSILKKIALTDITITPFAV